MTGVSPPYWICVRKAVKDIFENATATVCFMPSFYVKVVAEACWHHLEVNALSIAAGPPCGTAGLSLPFGPRQHGFTPRCRTSQTGRKGWMSIPPASSIRQTSRKKIKELAGARNADALVATGGREDWSAGISPSPTVHRGVFGP